MRLIDADELMKLIPPEEMVSKFAVANVPTVEAISVRHGKWRYYEGYLTCSECGTEYDDDIMTHCGDNVPQFCPNCGADMRGNKDE